MFVGTLQGVEMLGNRCSIGESHFHENALHFSSEFFQFRPIIKWLWHLDIKGSSMDVT